MGLKHSFHSNKTDPADPTIIGATKWNADHFYVDAAGAPIANVGALLLAGAAGALTHLNSVAAGQVLISAGVGALPVWGTSLTSVTVDATGAIAWATRTKMTAPADGRLLLTNAAGTDFSILQFGGTTAAFPALRRSGQNLILTRADDGAYVDLVLQNIRMPANVSIGIGAGSPEGVLAQGVGSLYLRYDGGVSTTLYVKQTGGATNTGWAAK